MVADMTNNIEFIIDIPWKIPRICCYGLEPHKMISSAIYCILQTTLSSTSSHCITAIQPHQRFQAHLHNDSITVKLYFTCTVTTNKQAIHDQISKSLNIWGKSLLLLWHPLNLFFFVSRSWDHITLAYYIVTEYIIYIPTAISAFLGKSLSLPDRQSYPSLIDKKSTIVSC